MAGLTCWAAQHNTWLVIKLMPKGVVFSFLFSGLTCNDGSGLEGFAQAHVVSQAAVQASAAQEGQPGDALPLVRPQLACQSH